MTIAVVDDLVSLAVIAVAYSRNLVWPALLIAVGGFGAVLVVRAARVTYGLVYAVLGLAIWVAVFRSGIDPVVVGLAFGLLTYAYPAGRASLEEATNRFRLFREQPTPQLAREARAGLQSAISPNERLQLMYHPWTAYLIVPLFAVANAGIPVRPSFLATAYTSPITLGILFGYVVGKPAGILGMSLLITRLSGVGSGRRWVGRRQPEGEPSPVSASPCRCCRHARLHRGPAGTGQARGAQRSAVRLGPDLAAVPRDRPARAGPAGPAAAGHQRTDRRPVGAGRPGP